ncbi:alpha/beta hydrolase [Halomonas urumqiensis]|uniref:Alpha/beta hydrolase n=1 Tax=Halomonas urumqiensis TaxID=1684789 RepID=A0A2N7UMJ9_9GAMM|nr:alpha/beta hydrolase [Halomonas urumqiensis]PMR81680.1 alpha/beta hydrolase [Halomonas urumqiensis]PTB02317.1 alpha/beta hydrolase [Halomonas urumqiensis]GHE21789.1 alpha/beta hydrolase [Halomonas urumqiensis]
MKHVAVALLRPVGISVCLASAGIGMALSPALAQDDAAESSPTSETHVFLEYSQAELDKAYDQRAWVSNVGEFIQGWVSRSEEARTRFERQTFRYGPSEREVLDLFAADQSDAPTLMFIHGGAWRAGSKEAYSLLADAFVPYGANVLVLNFDNIPDARLPDMAEQVRRAIVWTHENAAALGLDAEQLYITGHSSGGHLAGVMLTTDWAEHGLPMDALKGGMPVSGMFDLEPVMLSARSEYVDLDEAEEAALSPMRHLHEVRAPITLAYGGEETPEFQRHSRDFHEALAQSPYAEALLFLPELNHFEMMDSLADPDGDVAKAAREMMGLADD